MVDEVARGLSLFDGASSEVRRCGCRGTTEEAEAPRHLTHHKPAMPQPLRWCQEQRGLSGDGLERRGRRDRDRRFVR